MYTDVFGCIPVPFEVDWGSGRIEPVEDFRLAVDWVADAAHADGYIYPPNQHTVTENVDGTTTPVPKTTRPAHLWSPPATHRITLRDVAAGDENRRRLGGFLIHLAAFLYGFRAQFSDWWIDGRLLTKSRTDLVSAALRESQLKVCFAQSTDSWTQWSEQSRRVMANALYFHNRVPVYEWDWERFQAEYQVLDALYAVAKAELGTPDTGHRKRLEVLCGQFGVQVDSDVFGDIATYRNALVHEILWGEGMPGEGFPEGYRKAHSLRNINRRLGLAILGISCGYVRSPWRSQLSHMLHLDR
jgi:hypothetical protein